MLIEAPGRTRRVSPGSLGLAVWLVLATLTIGCDGASTGKPGGSDSVAAESGCKAVELPLETIYSLSATQPDDDELLILDYRNERLVSVDLPSGDWRVVRSQVGGVLENRRPFAIRRVGDHLLLEQKTPSMFVELDKDLGISPLQPRRLDGRTEAAGDRVVESIWTWEPAGDRHVVACSDIYNGRGDRSKKANWTAGFVRIPTETAEPTGFETLLEIGFESRTVLGCRLSLPLIAPLDVGRVYVLTLGGTSPLPLEETPRIYVLRPGSKARPLEAFPERFAATPPFASDPPRAEMPHVFAQIEAATMPAGLFSWEGHLYLLARSRGDSGTEWWLIRIDPETEELDGTIKIDSKANHLMVVPGSQYWTLLERGPVRSFLDQEVRRILVVPAEVIRSWDPTTEDCDLIQAVAEPRLHE